MAAPGCVKGWQEISPDADTRASEGDGQSSVVKLKDIVNLIRDEMDIDNPQTIYKLNQDWVNIEDVYRKQGWNVEFDKPGYNEDYDATYTFTIPF